MKQKTACKIKICKTSLILGYGPTWLSIVDFSNIKLPSNISNNNTNSGNKSTNIRSNTNMRNNNTKSGSNNNMRNN